MSTNSETGEHIPMSEIIAFIEKAFTPDDEEKKRRLMFDMKIEGLLMELAKEDNMPRNRPSHPDPMKPAQGPGAKKRKRAKEKMPTTKKNSRKSPKNPK